MEVGNDGDLEEGYGIKRHMRSLMDTYRALIGTDVTKQKVPFWDIVAITTPKEDMKNAFEAQIEEKYARGELPLGFRIHVTVDPPGPRLGNGGTALYALLFLKDKYQEELFSKKVLMIHSGGQSIRMPSASVLGKIFSPIPTDMGLYQMLDIKLAMFLPFLKNMPPGVFVTCADDFILYDIGDTPVQDLTFPNTGFTALAHPSSLSLGTKHGVYVIEDVEHIDKSRLIHQCNGLEVLQKPSESKMFQSGAILEGTDLTFSGGIQVKGHAVYTDSSYFFANDVTLRMLKFVTENGVACEIDAYGDFLQALGPRASVEYTKYSPNVTTRTELLQPTREKLFHLLKDSSLRIVVMNASRHVHNGSMTEYIFHFCTDGRFRSEMDLNKNVFNYWKTYSRISDNEAYFQSTCAEVSSVETGCVMHSVLPENSSVAVNSVVEFCHFDVPVDVGQNTIISNCKLCEDEMEFSQIHRVRIPSNLFLHTIPVMSGGKYKFATAVFKIFDNIKQSLPSKEVRTLPFLGKTVQEFWHVCGIYCTPDNDTANLWTLPVVPVLDSMSDSLQSAIEIAKAMQNGIIIKRFRDENIQFVSMADILELKHVEEMLRFRKELYHNIKKNLRK